MNVYRPDLKIALSKKDIKEALRELHELGFGRANRSDEPDSLCSRYPLLDRLTFELEEQHED